MRLTVNSESFVGKKLNYALLVFIFTAQRPSKRFTHVLVLVKKRYIYSEIFIYSHSQHISLTSQAVVALHIKSCRNSAADIAGLVPVLVGTQNFLINIR